MTQGTMSAAGFYEYPFRSFEIRFRKATEMKKSIFALLLVFAVTAAVLLVSCTSPGTGESTDQSSKSQTTSQQGNDSGGEESTSQSSDRSEASADTSENESSEETEDDPYFSKVDKDESYPSSAATIVFDGSQITSTGEGINVSGKTATITKAGTYIISGTSPDGQIVVDIPKTDKAQLVFKGLNLTCTSSAPVWIKSADKTVITLAKDTENRLTDAANYTVKNELDEPNACLFSKDDLTINGQGKLIINAKYNNGIGSKDDLKIVSGTFEIKSRNNALKGNDSVAIAGGVITIDSTDDGIKAENETEEDKGFIYIRKGTINIKSGDDGLQAPRSITIAGGTVTVDAGGREVNCDGTTDIAQGSLIKK